MQKGYSVVKVGPTFPKNALRTNPSCAKQSKTTTATIPMIFLIERAPDENRASRECDIEPGDS